MHHQFRRVGHSFRLCPHHELALRNLAANILQPTHPLLETLKPVPPQPDSAAEGDCSLYSATHA